MFALIESCPEQREGMGWTAKVLSLMAHTFIVSAAIAATRHVVTESLPALSETPIVWETPSHAIPTLSTASTGGSPGPLVNPLIAPIEIPHEIPLAEPLIGHPGPVPVEHDLPGQSISFTGTSTVTVGALPVDARIVEEQPELLSHPVLRYPEVLRQAGIEGRVVVETVLDSLGHPEAGSLRVLVSTHPQFDREALDVVQGSRYRPGRIAGRAVRVRVQVPVTFEIRR